MAKTRIPIDVDWENQRRRDALLECSVAELGLDVRTLNALEDHGILFVKQLVNCESKDLEQIPNFGPKTLNRIQKLLTQHGLGLRGMASVLSAGG